MKAVNISGSVVEFQISRMANDRPKRYVLQPGESVELDDGYCVRHYHAGGTQPSVIEKLTGWSPGGQAKVVPETDPQAKSFIQQEQEIRAQVAARMTESRVAAGPPPGIPAPSRKRE